MILSLSKSDSSQTISKNFCAGEFSCNCRNCQQTLVDEALVAYLQQIRDQFGKPLVITSGFRCDSHNAAVGGTKNSFHLKGQAADLYIQDVRPADIAKYAERIGILGIGLYDDFVHIDTRTQKSFWYGHQQDVRSTFGGNDLFLVELRILCRGCEGADVKSMQALLTSLGCPTSIDGIFGPATEAALLRFQKAHALTADGIAGPQTQRKLLGI